jgi:hypothetical protein
VKLYTAELQKHRYLHFALPIVADFMSKENALYLELFALSKKLVISCYELTLDLPEDEKTNFSRYIRSAALGLHINIAQANYAKPKKKEKLMRSSLNLLIILETASGILSEVGLAAQDDVIELIKITSRCEQLTKEIKLSN